MELQDLEKFIVLANTENMQQTAQHFASSPSAISKALKRLEQSVNTPLFERVGRHITLNHHGRTLLPNAVVLVNKANEAKQQLGQHQINDIKVAGPSILIGRWASVLARSSAIVAPQCRLSFDVCYEQSALTAVLNGEADIAIITDELSTALPKNLARQTLGSLDLVIAAGANHPLAQQSSFKLDALKKARFAVPERSVFCGEYRGKGCDGWSSQWFERHMPVVVNDYSVLIQLLKSGLYLGYVPSFWAREHQLTILECQELPTRAEQMLIVSWRQSLLESLLN